MLVGRDPELSALRALLAEVRTAGGAVALVGEPGAGKTALLTEARRRADGFVVAAARGVEGESELPFAGLADVVRPLLGRLGATCRRRSAMRSPARWPWRRRRPATASRCAPPRTVSPA